MEFEAPYLEAIQAVPGKTPGEKYKTIKLAARRIAAVVNAGGDFGSVIGSVELPSLLQPIVRVEVANILKQHEGITTALRSDDLNVINRAFQAKWFFNGSLKDVVNEEYFAKELLPFVSLNTRARMIRTLAKCLTKENELAEKLFKIVSAQYGMEQAMPLLASCNADFVYTLVVEEDVILSNRLVEILFRVHPDMVIKYLMLSKANDDTVRKLQCPNLCDYQSFLPKLVRNHVKAFTELFEHHTFKVKLGNKCAEMFLKNATETLIEKPIQYLPMLPLKIISAKLTKTQFRNMFRNLMPKDIQKYSFNEVLEYLDHYPEVERLPLILETFEEVYGQNLLKCKDLITIRLLRILPAEDRIEQARIKLRKTPAFNLTDFKYSWVCYLPVAESIPAIKAQISTADVVEDRACLISQLFYTCAVNDDNDALLDVLKYFVIRHRNENAWLRFNVLSNLMELRNISSLGEEHWNVLNEIITVLNVKDELLFSPDVMSSLIIEGIHYNLTRGLPIEDKMELLTEIKVKVYRAQWNIFEKFPEFERQCLDMFLTIIPKKYPQNSEVWKSQGDNTIEKLLEAIYDFNARNARSNNKMEKIMLKSYPWLLEEIKRIVLQDNKQGYVCFRIIKIIKEHEPDLYKSWLGHEEEIVGVATGEALTLLKKDHQKILKHWKEYLQNIKRSYYSKQVITFVKAIRWYQEIPIKFIQQCRKELFEENNAEVIMPLAILLHGSTFTRVIEPLVPTGSTLNIEKESAHTAYRIIRNIADAIKLVNPPVPLNIVSKYCIGDYLQLGLHALINVCRHTPSPSILSFARGMVDSRVSVKKHGIRLVCMVATMKELHEFLSDLWKQETHRSIRQVIFGNIQELFAKNPCEETWQLIAETVADLRPTDDRLLADFVKLTIIPNNYTLKYIQLILRVAEDKFPTLLRNSIVTSLLKNISSSICTLLPDEVVESILTKYLFLEAYDKNLYQAAQSLAIYNYLVHGSKDRLQSRMKFLSGHMKTHVKKFWNVPHPKKRNFRPMNHMVQSFLRHLASEWARRSLDGEILESFLREISAVISPLENCEAYVHCVCAVVAGGSKTPLEFGEKLAHRITDLVSTFSSEMIVRIADYLKDFLNPYIFEVRLSDDELTINVIEGLLKLDNNFNCILAAELLVIVKSKCIHLRYMKIIQILKEKKHPSVISILYNHLNSTGYSDCLSDDEE
ncbi:uncharacterized protein LOC107272468 [Cephus cinctus]|uniref:Uncharacterized protein LOC107272468 n=1 Tax=Cephus cinctus TaxID=211228 RepID=A0AAJ7C9B6_CEPCN|nr:uncharacterized protein LOC107272468 [Cephus cinctus]